MRKILLAFLFFVTQFTFSQTITGIVREKGSGLPLPFANIFINNTSLGAATDVDGKFRLTGNFSSEIELVASFVGYVTEVKAISFRGKNEVQIEFQLAFNESNLTEVELKSKRDKSWEREFRRFKEVFLALPDDPYKSQIEIHNPWVVDFEKVKVKQGQNYLRATAQEPLKITNTALGYEIDYYLQDFRVLRNGSRFYGQVFYEPIPSKDANENEQWNNEREANYHSSLRHLNRSILLNSPDSIHFNLYTVLPENPQRRRTNDFYVELDQSIKSIPKDSILRRPLGDGNYRIFLPGRIEIHHFDKSWKNEYYINVKHAISWIDAPEGYYDVDRQGTLINPTQLVLSGYLGRQRVARILPSDFEPQGYFLSQGAQQEVVSSPAIRLNRLREKAWLATNKPYFYPGETAWVGGRMLYQEQALSDTLSRVVYVDLVNSDAEIVQSATFPIENGKISGGMFLDQNLVPGDYALRSYTHWNQNFGEIDQFLTPLIIMEPGIKPKVETVESEPLYDEISVIPQFSIHDSLSYQVMDLKLEFLDELENPIDSDFILSITNAEAVVELDQGNSLEKSLEWLDKPIPDEYEVALSNPIEFGISIQGQFTPTNKKQPIVNPITVVRGDLEDYGEVKTDSAGFFWATGLYFQDTAKIAIGALDSKRRPYGKVELYPMNKPLVPKDIPKLEYSKEAIQMENGLLDIAGDFILLDEFVKEAAKEREIDTDWFGYGEPDRVITEEQMELSVTLCGVLQRMGFNCLTLKFGNYTFGERTGTPLLIIDGFKYPFLEGGEFKEMLDSYVPQYLESVGVYTFSTTVFGMAGYAGVIVLKTKRGQRWTVDSDRKFNSEGFQIFDIPGFTVFQEFPKDPPSDQFLKKKPTLFWDPVAQTEVGEFKTRIKIPYGVTKAKLRVEGMTLDGEPFYKMILLEF
ncbi:MAG: carboxypeptidase-like regulatory domain-containing protein [Algoriphagus sp.]|nr:carboxypeptidase-like regulatory domain-containing protein [Algoriphagus sp.]